MPAVVISEVRGLEETRVKMGQVANDLQGPPFLSAMREATLLVTRTAKSHNYVPVDTGRLRADILPEVREHGPVVQGVITAGTVVKYASFQEFGTRPFWPRIDALRVWARRHGVDAFVVARAIARRGIIPKRFMQRALEANTQKIFDLIGKVVHKIVVK